MFAGGLGNSGVPPAMTIKEKRDHKKPDHGVVGEALEVFSQRGETVLACEHLLLVKRRAA